MFSASIAIARPNVIESLILPRRWFWTLHGDKGLNRRGGKRDHLKCSMIILGQTRVDVGMSKTWWEIMSRKGFDNETMQFCVLQAWVIIARSMPMNRSFDINVWLPSTPTFFFLPWLPPHCNYHLMAVANLPQVEANLVASSVGDTMARDWGYWTGHFTGGMGWEFFFGWSLCRLKGFWRFQVLAGWFWDQNELWMESRWSGMIVRDHVSLESEMISGWLLRVQACCIVR